jgi:hypothetical protein
VERAEMREVILNENFLKNSPKGVKNKEIIEILFGFKEAIFDMENSYSNYKEMHEDLHIIEESIQEAFGFPQDKNYHRFWEWPGCACPVFDNMDSWGTPTKYYSAECPVHDEIILRWNNN